MGNRSSYFFHALLMVLLLAALNACKTLPETKPAEAEATADTTQSTEATAAAAEPMVAAATDAANGSGESAAEAAKPEEPKASAIAGSCKDEPYAGYEKQARDSIAKGLAALEAGRYGVGFRNKDEHKKWSDTQQHIFTEVNNACQALDACRKENAADATSKCGDLAGQFTAWQELAAGFAEKAKQAETIQPPIICSFKPNLDDPERCFHQLGDNVEKACDSAECKGLANCWRGVGFLDAAIKQAKSACGFVHKALDDCRGYTEAKGRRGKKLEQCATLQGELNIKVVPPL